VCPPDSAGPFPGPSAGVRERLRRLGAIGATRRPEPPLPACSGSGGNGVEVIKTRFAVSHRHGRALLGECLEALPASGDGAGPAQTVWLDTETTGLAGGTGTYVFLIGLASVDGTTFTVEQLLLRRLSAEGQLLALLRERLAGARHLVTFNGRRFDWPLLEARFVLTRLRPLAFDLHTDLIYPARRLWHRVLGTHRLSALEADVLGAPRTDDIAGWDIPRTYIQYLRSADRNSLEPILAHNRSDLLALIVLHATVSQVLRDPPGGCGPIDWEGAGVLLARRNEHDRAASCFEQALAARIEPQDRWRVLRRCARHYRSVGDNHRAHERWEEAARILTRDDRYKAQVLVEVARARKAAGDDAGARAAATEALGIARNLRAGRTSCSAGLIDRLERRAARLAEALAPDLTVPAQAPGGALAGGR
jgi:uncharacterized protein